MARLSLEERTEGNEVGHSNGNFPRFDIGAAKQDAGDRTEEVSGRERREEAEDRQDNDVGGFAGEEKPGPLFDPLLEDSDNQIGRQAATSQCGYGGVCRNMCLLFENNSDKEKDLLDSDDQANRLASLPEDSKLAAEGSEVRNGVPHGFVPGVGALGAGQSNGEVSEENDHDQTGGSGHRIPPYSQNDTKPSFTNEGREYAEEDEGLSGNAVGGTAAGHHEKMGLLQRMMQKLSGDKKPDGHSDSDDHSESSAVPAVSENGLGSEEALADEKYVSSPGLVTKMTDKILPSCGKVSKDELDPELWG